MKLSKFIKPLLLLLILVLTITFTACDDTSEPEEKVEETTIDQTAIDDTIQAIDEIGNVTLKKKDDINYANELYEGLKNEEKDLVFNYSVLESALRMLNYLENEITYIKKGYQECLEYLDNLIPSEIDSDSYSIDLPLFYEYTNEFLTYNLKLTWETSDEDCIDLSGVVKHSKSDESVTLNCTVSSLKTSETATFTKKIKILKYEMPTLTNPVVICYFYGTYNGFTETDIKTIDIVNYSFAQIAKKTEDEKTVYYIDVSDVPSINKISELHKYGIKVCLSLGGWHDDSSFWDTYSEAASTDENRKMVANSLLEVLQKYELDGIDMDWEYPSSSERNNFSLLMKQIYVTLKSKDSSYIISGAFPGGGASSRYDYKTLNNYFDYFNIMTYDNDFNGQTTTTHVTTYNSTINQKDVFINLGCSKEKIVLGMAFYGRASYVTSSTNNGLGQKYTNKVTLNYNVIKEQYLSRLGTEVIKCYDSNNQAYYLYDTVNKVFVSYDSEEILAKKYEYAYNNKIGGVMYWCYQNDTTGDLINAVYNAKLTYKK